MNQPSATIPADIKKSGEGQLRSSLWLVLLCSAVYFTSYLARKGYDASIIAICETTGLARTAAGLASTAAVAMYGTGQFITGFLADRFDPRRMIFGALLVTAACNATMPVVAGCVPAMIALWALNGFAQAMFWPPLVKIVAANLSPSRYKGAVFWISVAANAAIVIVFLLVSTCLRLASWRTTFAVVVCGVLAMAAIWRTAIFRLAPNCRPAPRTAAPAPGQGGSTSADAAAKSTRDAPLGLGRLLAASGMFFTMAAIACQGIMRDGIEVWAPSIVKDLYGLGTSGSVFSVALLPVFAVASMAVAQALRRALGDEIKGAIALFAIGLACSLALFATGGGRLCFGLPVLAVLSACMHGANLMLIGELPGRFAKFGCVGAVSGVLNAFTYVGAAISIYGFAALHDKFAGWRPVFALWIGVLFFAIVLAFAAWRRWSAFARANGGD